MTGMVRNEWKWVVIQYYHLFHSLYSNFSVSQVSLTALFLQARSHCTWFCPFLVSLDVAFSPHGIVSFEGFELLALCSISWICLFPPEKIQIENFVMITAEVILGTYLSVHCTRSHMTVSDTNRVTVSDTAFNCLAKEVTTRSLLVERKIPRLQWVNNLRGGTLRPWEHPDPSNSSPNGFTSVCDPCLNSYCTEGYKVLSF